MKIATAREIHSQTGETDAKSMTSAVSGLISKALGNNELLDLSSVSIRSMDDLIDFNDKVNSIINRIVIEKYSLTNRSEMFMNCLKSANLSTFTTDSSDPMQSKIDINMLTSLIDEKKRIYMRLMLSVIDNGGLNFSGINAMDIKSVLESGVVDFFDSMYKTYVDSIEHVKGKDFGDALYYGIPEKSEPESYMGVLERSNISYSSLDNIKNPELRAYLRKVITLCFKGSYEYDDWVGAEINEVNSWLGKGDMAFIGPMENYLHKNFVDPEFSIMFRQKIDLDPRVFEGLAKKYYGEGFGMDRVTVFQVEPIIEMGQFSYKKYLGKNFPNDPKLRDKHGNFIFTIKGNFSKFFDEYSPKMAKIFNMDENELKKDKSRIVSGALEETNYHEYGHNAFGARMDSEVEETKASLFYWLHLYDRHVRNKELLPVSEIKVILKTFTLDFTRYLSRLDNDGNRKYLLTAKVLLHHLQTNGLLSYDEKSNSMDFNSDDEKRTVVSFKNFLQELFYLLNEIEELYRNNDYPGIDNFVEFYNSRTDSQIKSLYENFK
ncbi:MAG: hypothetical protein PHS92_02950 [Candidatus Gracilibacteria bacterium]|nr:hypothetical protein [Candidatus Gracilibacteria bacterium]